MKIKCSYTELVDAVRLQPHPKNPNVHPDKQITRLAKIIDYQGQRSPVIVSRLSGYVIVGHGRLAAMKKLGWEKVAVDYQDFENEAMEYAHMTADNAISDWAELDLSQINLEMLDFGPELDINMLGIDKFVVEPLDKVIEDDDKDIDVNFDYKIEVDCGDEEQQNYLMGELNDRGFKVRILL